MRTVDKSYVDPLDLVWTHCASRIGIQIVRDAEVFASWDGNGTLRIGTSNTLDPDDCLAQMVFHELCHALVEGPSRFQLADWGLNMDQKDDEVREHAALRLQASLADQYGLRQFLASTTDFRAYFDRLGANPLADDQDPAVEFARVGWALAMEGDWHLPIDDALRQTQAIVQVVSGIAPEGSLWSGIKHQSVES